MSRRHGIVLLLVLLVASGVIGPAAYAAVGLPGLIGATVLTSILGALIGRGIAQDRR